MQLYGFLNNDEGPFPEYIRNFLSTAFTLVVQLTLLNLSILCLINAHLIYGIAIAIVSTKTPYILSKYMIRPASVVGGAGSMARSMRALLPRRRR